MIKKLVIFNVLILFCVSVFAKDKMDKQTFDNLVDYSNCQYLMTFIEKHDSGKDYIKDTYGRKVKPVLQKATLDNLRSIPDYNKIKDLFSNGSNNAALNLAEEINKRKGKFDEASDNKSLIEFLRASKWKEIDLTEVAEEIQKDIRAKFDPNQTLFSASGENEDGINEQTFSTSSQIKELEEKIDNLQENIDNMNHEYESLQDDSKIGIMQGKISTIRLLVIICLFLVVLLITALFLWYKKQFNAENRSSSVRKFVKNVFFSSEEIWQKIETKPKETVLRGGNDEVFDLKARINVLESRLDELSEKVKPTIIEEVQNNDNQQATQKTNNLPQQPNNPIQIEKDIYFASKNNKQLLEQQPNSTNASFKLIKIKGNDAEFEYVGAVKNENWFEGVCTIENLANDNLSDKKRIATTQPGKVSKENDIWVVTTPAKIKFV